MAPKPKKGTTPTKDTAAGLEDPSTMTDDADERIDDDSDDETSDGANTQQTKL